MSFIFSRKTSSTKKRSKHSERRAAKILDGRVQPASGALNQFNLKADVKSSHFLVDDKTTARGSFSVSVALWRKLSREAWMNKRAPLIRIEFSAGPSLYVMDEVTFMKLKSKL